MIKEWDKKGCSVCRKLWEIGQTPPMLAESIENHTRLYKCDICQTFWEEYERYADEISEESAKQRYPDSFKGELL